MSQLDNTREGADIMPTEIRRVRQRRIANLGPNRSVHGSSNYGTRPQSIYFYYLAVGPDGRLAATPGFFQDEKSEIRYQDLKERAAILVDEARNGTLDPPPDECGGVSPCWTRRSWLLYVLGDPGLQFRRHAMVVRPAPPNLAYNHAFFDGREFPVIAGTDRLSATACINHLYANEHQDDLAVLGDYQEFDIRLHYDRVRSPGVTDDPLEFDSGGTNMGPPVPPPVVPM
jgi:hypothetical protein